MFGKRNCSVSSCTDAAVATLVQQNLCLNHFLAVCYERLERLEPAGTRAEYDSADLTARKDFVEECSREALRVGLHGEGLCNLQRGRLLDILLWAGDLFVALRTRIAAPPPFYLTSMEQLVDDDDVYPEPKVIRTRPGRSEAISKSSGNIFKKQAARA